MQHGSLSFCVVLLTGWAVYQCGSTAVAAAPPPAPQSYSQRSHLTEEQKAQLAREFAARRRKAPRLLAEYWDIGGGSRSGQVTGRANLSLGHSRSVVHEESGIVGPEYHRSFQISGVRNYPTVMYGRNVRIQENFRICSSLLFTNGEIQPPIQLVLGGAFRSVWIDRRQILRIQRVPADSLPAHLRRPIYCYAVPVTGKVDFTRLSLRLGHETHQQYTSLTVSVEAVFAEVDSRRNVAIVKLCHGGQEFEPFKVNEGDVIGVEQLKRKNPNLVVRYAYRGKSGGRGPIVYPPGFPTYNPCQYVVRKIVPPDTEAGIMGWIELCPAADNGHVDDDGNIVLYDVASTEGSQLHEIEPIAAATAAK